MHIYSVSGVCARKIRFNCEDNKIKDISFVGGCDGNLSGICKLVEGMEIDQVIERLKGIRCNSKFTSCPDQLAMALEDYKINPNSEVFEIVK
ncbi:TIGR03905 family TSCPD domain-containing protein [Clostridium sp.]|uniref:TIGR03905 family TSCPD domain-containing protein n=1 Tax=Clostridium sp. TaxID=1506 RepID=UPI002FC753F9